MAEELIKKLESLKINTEPEPTERKTRRGVTSKILLENKQVQPKTTRTRKSTTVTKIKTNPCIALRFEGFIKRASKNQQKPIAIIIVGPVASGKTTTLKTVLPPDFDYDYYNLDDYHEYLLEKETFIQTDKITKKKYKNLIIRGKELLYEKYKAEGIEYTKETIDLMVDENPELVRPLYNSIFSKLITVANKCIDEDIQSLYSTANTKNVVIDTTGGSYQKILTHKQMLEGKGYRVIMVALYATYDTTKQRNEERYRSVPLGGVLSSWLNTISNLDLYKKLFEDDYYLINTDSTVLTNDTTVRIQKNPKLKTSGYVSYIFNFDGAIKIFNNTAILTYYGRNIKEDIYNKLRQQKYKSEPILKQSKIIEKKIVSI